MNKKKKSNNEFNKVELKLLNLVATKVRKDLHDKDRSIEWLAWESDVSRSTVQRVLDANRNIGIITLNRISKGLGYKDVLDLLSEL